MRQRSRAGNKSFEEAATQPGGMQGGDTGSSGGSRGEGSERGESERGKALEYLRLAMVRQPKYITAMCNMAHLLSLRADTVADAGMLHLQASCVES